MTLWLTGMSFPLRPASFCASSAAELQAALTAAASNGQADVARIVQGTYAGNFIYGTTETHEIAVEGGYTAAAGLGLLTRRTPFWTGRVLAPSWR